MNMEKLPISLIFFSLYLVIIFKIFNNLFGDANKISPSKTKTSPIAVKKSFINYFLPLELPKNSKKSLVGERTIVVSPSLKALL